MIRRRQPMKRGGELKRTEMPKRRTRLAPRSQKRDEERALRQLVVDAALERDGRRCVARSLIPEIGCRGPLDPHEIIPRSAWRAGYLVLANVVTICRGHHDWVGDHPAAAHDLGLHGFSWER